MSSIKKVIIAGVGSDVGLHVLSALHEAGFAISALTRTTSTTKDKLPSYVTVIETDFTPDSLSAAFQGQDAVVSCIGAAGVHLQTTMIDVAEQVGIRRFIPSEFGLTRDRDIILELSDRLKAKNAILDYLDEKCKNSTTLTWSAVGTGPFLDLSLTKIPSLGFNVPQRTGRIVDSGNEPVTGSTGAAIGSATAHVLLHAEKTANRFLTIRSVRFTQNKLLTVLEEVTGSTWDISKITVPGLKQSMTKNLEAKQLLLAFLDIFAIQLFEDGAGRGLISFEESDNEMLGVREESLVDAVRRLVAIT